MNKVQEIEIRYQHELGRCVEALTFIQENRAALESLGLHFSHWYGTIDFDNLKHPEIVRVIKAFPGKWEKKVSWTGDGIDYTLRINEEQVIRCYNGEPPASCKVEETVTYELVPEHMERKVTRKVVCPEKVEAQSEPQPEEAA